MEKIVEVDNQPKKFLELDFDVLEFFWTPNFFRKCFVAPKYLKTCQEVKFDPISRYIYRMLSRKFGNFWILGINLNFSNFEKLIVLSPSLDRSDRFLSTFRVFRSFESAFQRNFWKFLQVQRYHGREFLFSGVFRVVQLKVVFRKVLPRYKNLK